MRASGILFPVFSLPSRFGIGCFSREAFEFIDFLKKAGQTYWQILPLGPTGFGDSPYQSFSAFAGNPYFISPEKLIEDGLLGWEDLNGRNFGQDQERVDYGALFESRPAILDQAFHNFARTADKDVDYQAFLKKEADWVQDYALFMAIKKDLGGMSWLEWDTPLKKREPAALREAGERLKEQVDKFLFIQYEFQKQWDALHKYAGEQGIQIIGDIPFYAAMDSADCWSHPEVFDFDKDLNPRTVAGCAPDAFSATGQRWGNPVYDWKAQKRTGYSWWVRRMQRGYELVDVVRIDHFHGFCNYYAVPYEDETAENGKLLKGPGMDFFRVLKEKLGDVNVIAEDLGVITPETEKLLEESGFPGMKVLEYAFDWSEYSYYMTHNHGKNSVVYTGTHDNPPVREWIDTLNDHDRDLARRYIGSVNTDYGQFTWDMIREAYRSPADLSIVPIQDYLVKGKEARINTPGTQGSNWQWRIAPNFLSDELASSIRSMARLYCRLPVEK